MTASSKKHWLKYLAGLTEKQKEHLRERLAIFKEDVFDKRLKTHRLKGNLKEYYAFSISYSDRIVFKVSKSLPKSISPVWMNCGNKCG